jgi:hypothetical protein
VAAHRFVLRYRGSGLAPEADVARVAELPSTVVVDATPNMLLVESDADELEGLVADLPDWVMAPERGSPIPDTRKRVERPPPDTS